MWANPVPGAQALVERDGRVLLGRRRDDPAAGLWDIPGGFVEEQEHPLEALRRELREETGLEIEPTEFLGMWMQPYNDRNVLSLTWLARPTGGEERAGDDLTELRWFAPDELPGAGRAARSRVTSRSCHSGARGTSTRRAPGSIRNASGVSSSTGSPSTAARIRGSGEPISSSVQLRSSQVIRRKPCGM